MFCRLPFLLTVTTTLLTIAPSPALTATINPLSLSPRNDDSKTASSSDYTKDDEFRKTILNVTNTYRRQHNATGLRWNESLAKTAKEWSERCVFEHSVCISAQFTLFPCFPLLCNPHPQDGILLTRRKTQGGSTGENLSSGYTNASAAVIVWGDERKKYDFKKGEFSKEVGHFTQLVWKGSSDVGCGRTEVRLS